MITTVAPNTSPMNFNILANRLNVLSVNLPPIIDKGSFCWCSIACVQRLLVFHGNSGVEKENDKSDFLFYRISTNDTVVMELWKNGVKIDDLDNNDNGTYYDFGSLANTNLKGYLIDWFTVNALHGSGQYQIKATSVILGQTYTYESATFELMGFNELAADNTVRIESYQDGYTESSPIDFTGVNWYGQIRLFGQMRDKQPVFTTDNYKDSLRTKIQIQDSINYSYNLELTTLQDDLKDFIVEQVLLANQIIITDYTLANNDRYKPTPLYPVEITNVEYNNQRPGGKMEIKFSDKIENIIKRNIYF